MMIKTRFGLILLACFLATSRPLVAEMTGDEIEMIRESIRNKGASWTAGENDITRLSREQRLGMLGGQAPTIDMFDNRRELKVASPLTLPAYFSWGNASGHNWMTPIRNQGYCGSCWAFAACGMFESRKKIMASDYNLAPDVSEQNMVSCWGNGCNATTLDWTIMNFLDYGSPDEACFPYQSGDGSVPSCELRCPDWEERLYEIQDWSYMYLPNTEEMKYEIYDNGPVAVWMMIYSDFYSYNGGVYIHTSGSEEGGHFIVIYGWDSGIDNCWLAKNSWGINWGEVGPDGTRGWFRIRKGTNEAGCESWIYSLVPKAAPCNYLIGDINSDGQRIGGDVTYGVRYFKSLGPQPPDSCYLDSTHAYLYAAGDVNGNCEFRGSDITRLVAYFKSTATLSYCHFFPTALPPILK